MMCPVCKRELAPTLSICLTCGAMINDTVREELETKISRTAEPVGSGSGGLRVPKPAMTERPAPKVETPQTTAPKIEKPQMATPNIEKPKTVAPPPAPKPVAARFDTADLRVKKTSPTLVDFQTKKATVPEWRLQLQNSVRQKVGTNRRPEATNPAPQTGDTKPTATKGANALKVEYVEEEQTERHQNPRVASALKRIEESRRVFSNQPVPEQSVQIGKPPASRNYPFNVVARSNETGSQNGQRATVNPSPKPMLVSSLKIEKKGFDTNKLPKLPKTGTVSSRVELPVTSPAQAGSAAPQMTGRKVKEETIVDEDLIPVDVAETDEIDDLAPLSMRFSAGLFDMIIGLFASLILLSPFMLSGGTWLTVSGFFAIAAAVAIVMFLYMTISLAFVGRTFGMRLFSLELVDVEENAYPSLHQAAVSSAVYLLSLALAGIGFLPIFFNEERRAAHDILSGTILVREY